MNSTYPKISIITPCFNDVDFLEKTILSVVNQSYPNLEYIVIDGGSTDGSVDIIRKYNDRISYWISERDQGMYYAIQKGFELSTGEIMGWINSDDIHHPGSLFTLAQVFSSFSEINWLQGMPNVIDEAGRIVQSRSGVDLNRFFFYEKKHVQTDRYIQQESTFWRRSLWEKAGNHISTSFKFAGDFELWIRFFKFDKLYNTSALLGSFRSSRSGQISTDKYQEYVDETLQVLEKHPLSVKEKRQMRYLGLLEKIQNRVNNLNNRIIRWLNLDKESNVNEGIHFDYKTQEFKK